MLYIGFIRADGLDLQTIILKGVTAMTYLEVVFNYGAIPG